MSNRSKMSRRQFIVSGAAAAMLAACAKQTQAPTEAPPAEATEAPPAEAGAKLTVALKELDSARKKAEGLERELSRSTAESLLPEVRSIGGILVLSAKVSASSMESLRLIGDRLREQLRSAIIVLGAVYDNKPYFVAMVTSDLTARGYHAGDLVKRVAAVTGGSGGGRPVLGQAGGRDKGKIDEALRSVEELVRKGGKS